MIWLLLMFLLFLLTLSYRYAGKDFFAPATVQILSFSFSVAMGIYWMWSIDVWHDFHWETMVIIASVLSVSAAIGIIVHRVLTRTRIGQDNDYENSSPISKLALILLGCFVIAVVCWELTEIVRIAGTNGSFGEIMKTFRNKNSYSSNEEFMFPFLLRQSVSLIQGIFIITGFNFICFYKKLSLQAKVANVALMGLCVMSSLLTGARSGVVNILIGLAVFYHILRIRRMHGFFGYTFKTVVKVVLSLCLMLYSFVLVNHVVGRIGRTASLPALSYLSVYTGSEPILLDQYLQNPPPPSDMAGKYSFYALIRNLQRLGIVTYPRYLIHLEFRGIGKGYGGNTYSFIRIYHYDYGLLGLFVLHALMVLTMSLMYEYTKKRLSDKWIIIFGSIYYCIVLSFFAERFYSNLFAFSFLLRLGELFVLHEVLIKKKIRLRLGSPACLRAIKA